MFRRGAQRWGWGPGSRVGLLCVACVACVVCVACADEPRPRTVEREPPRFEDGGEAPDGQAVDAGAAEVGLRQCVALITPLAGAPVECTLAPADQPSCRALAECLCDLAPAADREVCLWSLVEPRALINLSSFCDGQVDLAQVLGRMDWPGVAPVKFSLEASAGCAEHPAAL